jgi:hypothetical protein
MIVECFDMRILKNINLLGDLGLAEYLNGATLTNG